MLNVEKNKKRFWFDIALFLIVIGLFYITYMRYNKFFEIDNDGYILTSNKIVEKLYNQSLPENESKIDYKKVTSKDTLYKKNDKYYIGESNKNEVVINYPMISENGSRVTILNNKNTLINDKFISINAFNNAIITNGYLYNGVSLDKVNDDNYILIGVDSNIYVNTVKIRIIKEDETYTIPENSIVYFLESEIRYYYLDNETFKYARIGAINDKDIIAYNDTSMEYYEYLDKLGLLEKIEEIPEEKNDDDIIQTPTDEITKPNENKEEEIEEIDEDIYIKPEVTGVIEKVNTYTLFLNTDIKDPNGKITTLPTYEIIYNNNTYSRKTVYFSGQTKITGLIPNTEFSIIGYYIYKDQNGKSLKKTIIDESFKTGNIDNLNSINLSYNNDNIYSNKIEINNLKITNNDDDEVLNGIKKVEVVINDQSFNLGNDQTTNLKKLNEITYKTANVLESNTIYNVTLNFYDLTGNLLKSTNNKFQTKTAKQESTCKIQIESTDLTKFTANLVFSNPDDIVLNNLKYIVTDMKNTILKEGSITKDKIFIDDLDANSIYNFSVYADYDIEDGKGLKTNVLLNTTKVSTTPISNLGLVRYTFNEKNISQNEASYDIVLDTLSTNKKLIELLDEVNIEVTDPETNEEVTNIILKDEDITSLKSGGPFNISLNGLLSMTTYNIRVTNIIRQGSKTYEVSSKTNSFKTLKKAAQIEIVNRFFNENMIDFDVRVSDPDGSIETDRVILEVRDENDTLVKIEILDINDDYKRLSFTKLEKEKNYKFTYIAETYNEGYSKNGYVQDKKLLEEKIKTEVGIYGSLELESVLKEITSKNLFDIASTKRWKKDGTSTIDSKQMDILDKTINLSAKNGYANYSYFLPEAKGEIIKVTFSIKYAANSNEQNIYLSTGAGSAKQFNLNDLTNEYKKFSFTFGLSNNCYLGFYIDEITNNNTVTSIDIKDLNVEIVKSQDYPESTQGFNTTTANTNSFNGGGGGSQTCGTINWVGDGATDIRLINGKWNNLDSLKSRIMVAAGGGASYISDYLGCYSYKSPTTNTDIYNEYKEKDRYNSTLYANLYDTQNQLDDKNFYIELYNKGELEDTYSYPMNENSIENYLLYYELKKNTDYEIVINVKIRGRLYAINSIDVSTEDETRAIKSVDDFFAMHSNGKYVVTEDLDFRNTASYYSSNFTGKIDFQGHSIYIDAIKSSRLMDYVSYEAVLKNIDAHFYFDNTTSSRSYFYGLVNNFSGLMSNAKLTVETTNNKSNLLISLACYANRGIIENFVVNNKSGFSGERTIGFITQYNYGIIRNGYLYGENINASFPKAATSENKRIGAVAAYAGEQSKIVNIYSLIGIDGVNPLDSTNYESENRIGSLVGEHDRGIVSNSYSYTSGNNRVLTRDANIGVVSSTVRSNDLYYVSDDSIFAANQSTKVSKLALRDKDFQNVINGDNMFEIDDYVTYGYYPHIKWPDSMPQQEYIQLPKTNDKDLIDILNTKSVKTNDDGTATVVLNINNPAADKISLIKIKDINTVDIINQENENGKSKLTIKLSNPIKYVSKYNIMSITAKNGYGKTYTQEYENNEKVILIDLYRIINNIADLKLVNTYYNENFMLNTDFDFNGTNQFVINSYYGKFNGNGHTIKNVTITSGKGFIQNLYGTVMNLKFENVKRTTSSIDNMYGLIGQAYTNSVIDNIHIKDTSFIATGRMAALVGYSNGAIIKNCSATNVSNLDVTGRVDIKVGGLVAEMYNTIIENCYTQNVNFDTTPSTITYAVGGLVGLAGGGSISNTYSTGYILSGYQNSGGLVGYNSSTIKNSYTNVEISSKEEYIGGIAGYSSTTAISNVLATGSIYTSSMKKNIKRIAGNQDISNNAFAWAEQYIDGFYTGQSNGERLLTTDDLSQKMFYEDIIELGAFNYDDLENGKLPKLYSTDSKTLLPNQEDNFLKEKAFTTKSIKVIKEQDTATVDIQIDNPNNYEVKSIEVDGLNTTIRKLQTVDGITRIELYVTPIKYYDSYRFKSFIYKDENGNEKKFKLDGKIPVQFFKKLSTYTDWQAISSTDAENYLLVNDIDFEGKTNIKTNVIFNRLIVRMNEDGSYDSKTIKNMIINVSGSDKYLINRINCEMSNINFDNIKFTNTSTSKISNNGLIGYAFGDFHNNSFNNINLTLTKATFAGIITFDRSDEIRDISLNNITVTGRGYVSGFISRSIARAINNISYDTINVTATEDFSGGIIAYMDYKLNPDIYNINGNKSTVISNSNYVGSIFGYGGCNGVNATNSTVKGASFVGGIAGQAGVRNLRNAILNTATITATGNNTGGIAGSSENIISSYADDLTITSSGNNVGGIGGTGGYNISTSGIRNSTITSTGSYVGGIRGILSHSGVNQCYCLDTDIKGANYVGGLAGGNQGVSSTVSYSMTNANITATNSSAGGILGYANNTNTTKDDNKIYVYYNIVANAKVTSKSNAGGMIGRVDASIYPGHMYSNVINADISNTESTSGHGFVIGSGDYYASLINNYRVSSSTTMNGESVKLKDGITANNIIDYSLLATQSTYTNISFSKSYFNFDKLSSGYYPYIKIVNSNYYAYFKLPETNSRNLNIYNMALRTYSAKNLHLLPTFDIYPSDVNKINIEFNEIDPLTTFTINNKIYNIEKKVYTFYYNYTDDLNIIINDGINFKKYKYKSDVLSNKVYVNKDLYYFIKDNELTTNDKIKNNKNIVNLYDNELLLENGDIISLKEDKKIGKNTKSIIECSTSPLYTFTYNSNYIETFYNFSKINGEENSNLIFVKNSNIEMLNGTMNTYRQSMIIDNYNNNNYMVTLSKDGYIYNLKDKIKFPSKFDNNKIIGMNNNLYSDTNYIALVYENGTFIVFNYHTGKIVYTNYKNTDNFIEYYVSKIVGNGYKEEEYNTIKSYNDSSKLINKLEIKPITETKENEEISYKQVYNNSKKSYDIIEITNIDNKKLTNEDLSTKVNEEINSNINLYNYYYSNNNKSNTINKVFEIIIFVILLTGVIISSIILGINIKKKNENTN